MGKREPPAPMMVSISIVTGTVVFIALIMIIVSQFLGKTVETIPLLICGTTMLIAGCASLFVTRWARGNKRFFAVHGLLGVTTIMIVPLLGVVIVNLIAENTLARLVFSYYVLYYLMFLPVGAWLIMPPKQPQGKTGNDDKSQQE